jgi:hypothetical protein
MADGHRVRLVRSTDDKRSVLGDEPVPINDGRYLRLTYSLLQGVARDGESVLKVEGSSLQYQADPEGDQWVFRYDFIRQARDAHPQSHLQLNAEPRCETTPLRDQFERVHFHTGRFTLEGVIRCLIEQFGVETNTATDTWRPALYESERLFLLTAYHPPSGPEV